MTYEQITDLLNKGFTPEQITMLTTSAAAPTPAADSAPEDIPANPLPDESSGAIPEPVTAPGPASPAPDPAPVPEPVPAAEGTSNEVLEAIKDLKRTIQANNILTHSMDTVDQENALEKAMAEFIRPSFDTKD